MNIVDNKKWSWIFLVIVLLIFLHIEIVSLLKTAPERVLIFVPNDNENISCKANVFEKEKVVEVNKDLVRIDKISNYVDITKWDIQGDKGYYYLDTGMTNYYGKFKIDITCFENGKYLGVINYNNTHIPCEIKENGFLIC